MTESNLYQSPTQHLQYHEGTGLKIPKCMLVTIDNMLFFCLIFCIQHKVCLQFIGAIASGNNKIIQVLSQSNMFSICI